MAAEGTLYTCKDNFRSQQILIAAEYGQAKLKVCQTPPAFIYGETNQSAAFLAKFPYGKVPAFEAKDGQAITESNAISYYVASADLRGKTDVDKVQVVQWMSFADNEIVPPATRWTYPCLGIMPQNKQTDAKAQTEIKAILAYLNKTLLPKTFLVGERLSLADIAVFSALLPLYKLVLDPSFRKPYTNVNRWFETILNQPNVKSVLGEVKLCEKMAQFDAKTYAEIQGNLGAAAKKDKGNKKEEKKEKPASAKKKPANDSEPDEPIAAPPKKDPFDQFPKGSFVMEDFKRYYSNEDTAKSIPYFWDKFDPDHYSIWYCEYKYPEDLTQVFMSCNLISGMFQRLDTMRKNAFGSVCLFGEDNCSTISGIWVWPGPELAFTLNENWQIDYESYMWKKLDPKDPTTKTMVNEYLAWEGQFGGKKFNQGKIFK
ncbi:elongation factor 1-gamma-like [Tropilaelaps mercedesae]|uniref:eEF-1B gamma n=1 Tax=Tropilaelaps mercedesae TaxID=418985 RepID=A0A1V9XVR7_9ACAR|nr:elongation factor 1-gamma-like [Tropilaelaps mercedesae]